MIHVVGCIEFSALTIIHPCPTEVGGATTNAPMNFLCTAVAQHFSLAKPYIARPVRGGMLRTRDVCVPSSSGPFEMMTSVYLSLMQPMNESDNDGVR
jgi:hypothetical protein